MDSLYNYQQLVKRLLCEYTELENYSPEQDIETQVIFDESRDRYMMFRTGWLGNKRIRTAALYVRLQDGKIWIEEDLTEDGLATDLLAAGVPKDDIVLGFHHPAMRPYTEFAVA